MTDRMGYHPIPNCPTRGCSNTVPLHVISYYRAPYIRPTCHACTITKLMGAENEIKRLRVQLKEVAGDL